MISVLLDDSYYISLSSEIQEFKGENLYEKITYLIGSSRPPDDEYPTFFISRRNYSGKFKTWGYFSAKFSYICGRYIAFSPPGLLGHISAQNVWFLNSEL